MSDHTELRTWDPLEEGGTADAEIISAAQKRQIQNILKSYVGQYDSFSELIQNAMDSVDRRGSAEETTDYEKLLSLTIDLVENTFTIVDNGIGFNSKEFESFLAPNISFKKGDRTRGNKGVGATYIAYGFNLLRIGTKTSDHQFFGEMKGGRTWVDDKEGVETRPIVKEISKFSDELSKIDRGSIFAIKFGGTNTRPTALSWYTATTAEQWKYLLLLKTPLGSVQDENSSSDIKFNLKVISKDGVSEITGQEASYIFPHDAIKASLNLQKVLDYQQKRIAEGRDAGVMPPRFTSSNGIYEHYSSEDILKHFELPEPLKGLVSKYKITAYGYFAYSTSIWTQFNDTLAKLRKGFRILRGGLQIANNGMIQGELISIPLTSNIGYQNQCHVIVHFSGADPDLGRKGFQPELKEAAEKISVQIVSRQKRWRSLLKSDSGELPDLNQELKLHDWIKEQETYETKNPLLLTNPNFFAPVHELAISSIPQSEQDVIVLFNQLIAGGVIRGIRLLATSQVKQYDGVYRFSLKEPINLHEFDKVTNPLGVETLTHTKPFCGPPMILEYKHNLDALIREFESEYKSQKDINLAVTWELGKEWKREYTVTSLLDMNNLHQRRFHGITHTLSSGTNTFHVIVLKEMIDFLNDVDGVQQYQQETYGDDLF